eukprot:459502-Rhodomonas_salina.1
MITGMIVSRLGLGIGERELASEVEIEEKLKTESSQGTGSLPVSGGEVRVGLVADLAHHLHALHTHPSPVTE